MYKLKKIVRFFKRLFILSVILLFALFLKEQVLGSSNIFSKDYESQYIYLIDRESKEEIVKINHKKKAYPASLTKIMTTILALEKIKDLSAIAPIDVNTYKEMVASQSSMAGFYGKEETTYRDLLYGTILTSGGEAANSLAINLAGNTESFVEMMNNKAAEIGLEDTHFTNPEGLHDKKQYTTAYDMAKLLDYALADGDFRAIFTKKNYMTKNTLDHPEGIYLESTVLSKLDPQSQKGFEIIGGKSGTTSEAGQSWITLAVKHGHEYIGVVMGAEFTDFDQLNNNQIKDTLKLYEEID